MAFKVNYSLDTGAIVSYQGGGTDDDNACPEGCDTLAFADVFPQMFDSNGNVVMKVDVKAKQLAFINPVVIPQPIG